MRHGSKQAIAALAALAAMIGAPALVSADTGGGSGPVFATITVAVGRSAPLTAKLIAKVPIDITCTLNQAGIDAGASTTPDFSFVNVQLTQAVTKTTIAQGYGGRRATRLRRDSEPFLRPGPGLQCPVQGRPGDRPGHRRGRLAAVRS